MPYETNIHTSGLHHVTAIGGDPQRNVDFYLTVLGLRLVKTTVNFDDPGTYHLYYGDQAGNPGSLLTFFPWRGAPRGRRGTGQATSVAFSVPENSLGWWLDHLTELNVSVGEIHRHHNEETLELFDPDGLALTLVAHSGEESRNPWDSQFVPAEHAIRGLHSISVSVVTENATSEMFTGGLGLDFVNQNGNRLRFAAGDNKPGSLVDVVVSPESPRGLVAAGTIHHVAWRAPDEASQAAWREELVDNGVSVTSIIDRQYFRSIYFREPSGTLLEIATDEPGFTIDEPLLELGQALKLPPWLEPDRADIENMLPALNLPTEAQAQRHDEKEN